MANIELDIIIHHLESQGLNTDFLKQDVSKDFVFACDSSCGTLSEDFEQGERCLGCPCIY
jgi:hypothetical protein